MVKTEAQPKDEEKGSVTKSSCAPDQEVSGMGQQDTMSQETWGDLVWSSESHPNNQRSLCKHTYTCPSVEGQAQEATVQEWLSPRSSVKMRQGTS